MFVEIMMRMEEAAMLLFRRLRLGLAQLHPDVQFYLTVLLMLAVANSLFILVGGLCRTL